MEVRQHLVILVVMMLALSACLEPESYPPEPRISFKALEPSGMQAVLRLNFTDGDGDIGLDQNDTSGVFCPDTCRYHYNLFLEYYELQHGEWVHIELDPEAGQVPFYYRVPRVEPSGQNPALNGEIKLDMPAYYLFTDFDTARFEIQLVDRSLNESNIATTPLFVKPD